MSTNVRGRFISFEGVDGAGKSSHIQTVAEKLKADGINVVMTREPGGTPLGEKLRELLLHEPMHPETEALMMFASRREHINQVIEPALARGDWVISDRFVDSSFAYQFGGRGVAMEKMKAMETLVCGSMAPDLTFFFDLPVQISLERLRYTGQAPDKFEKEQEDFFERVRLAYLYRVNEDRQRFEVIDAAPSKDAVEQSVLEALGRRLETWHGVRCGRRLKTS